MVGVPMAYLTAVTFAIYLVSAFLLRETSGYPFSLLPAAAWIAVITLVFSGNRLGRPAVWSSDGWDAGYPLCWGGVSSRRSYFDSFPNDADYPLTDYALIALIGLICFGVTVASVARQRRGDAQTAIPSTPGSGLRGWLVNLFRFPCPTSSATRAQVWFDLKSNGLPVLTIGVALAMVILLLSAVGNPIDAAFQDEIRANLSCTNNECFYARACRVVYAALANIRVGPRRKCLRHSPETRTHVRQRIRGDSAVRRCAAGRPQGTREVGLRPGRNHRDRRKRMDIGALLGDAIFVQIWNVPLSSRLPEINSAIAALTGYEQLSMVFLAAVGVVIWVAAFAVFGALRTRYSRRVNIAAASLLLFVLAFALVAQAEPKGSCRRSCSTRCSRRRAG